MKTSTDVTQRDDATLQELFGIGVSTPAPDEVRRYLGRYPELSDSVLDVSKATLASLPPDARLSLEVYRDPEVDDEYLALYVRLPRYADSIATLLDEVGETADHLLQGKDGWLLVTTDYRPA